MHIIFNTVQIYKQIPNLSEFPKREIHLDWELSK